MATRRARSLVGWTLLIVGVLMAAQWLFFLATGSVAELQSAPRAIAFHLAAESVTAVLLVVAGVGLVRGGGGVGESVGLIASGALLYTVINSAGYFAERGEWAMVAMFGGMRSRSTRAARTRSKPPSRWLSAQMETPSRPSAVSITIPPRPERKHAVSASCLRTAPATRPSVSNTT